MISDLCGIAECCRLSPIRPFVTMNVQQTVELPICSANAPLPFPHYHRHHHSHHYYHHCHPPQTHPTLLKKNDNGCFIFLVASVVLKPTCLATAQTNVWLFVVCASCPMSRNTNTQTCKSSQLVVLEEGVCSCWLWSTTGPSGNDNDRDCHTSELCSHDVFLIRQTDRPPFSPSPSNVTPCNYQ